jgi:hypothetical protein
MTLKDIVVTGVIVSIVFFMLHVWLANPAYFGTSEKEFNVIRNESFISNSNKVFTEQLKFREKLINDYNRNLSSIKSTYLDSLLQLDSVQSKIGIRYLLPRTKWKFTIPLSNFTLDAYFLIGYDTLYVEYSIDQDKISSIIQNLKITPAEFINVLKFQDYLNVSTRATFHHRIAGLMIFFGIAVFLFALFVFIGNSERKDEDEERLTQSAVSRLSETHKMFYKDRLLRSQSGRLPPGKKEDFDRLVKVFDKKIAELEQRNKAYFIIEEIVSKAESKSREVQNRSTLMLVSGLIMAFIGVVVFYFTLPSNISATTDIMKIITLSVRPTLILIFIEAVSWYLLKQHKVLLDDYKYYHSIYNKKVGYLAAYKLVAESELADEKLKSIIPAIILSEEIKKSESVATDDSPIETSNRMLTSLFDKILTKF